jgi:hypothetical protein
MKIHHHKSNLGAWLICFFSLVGFFTSIYNFFLPDGPISHTAGVQLMIITTIIIAVLAVLLYFFRHLHARWERVSIYIIITILLLGSIFAAFLLESWLLLAMLILAFISLIIQFLTR